MKKLIALALTLFMALSLAACAAPEAATAPAAATQEPASAAPDAPAAETKEGGYNVAILTWSMAEEFGVDVVKGAQYAADQHGINLVNLDPAGDMQKEIAIIEDLVQQDIDAVVIAPVDAEAVVPYIDMMVEAGIIVVDYDIETSAFCHAYVMSDHYQGGWDSAEIFLERHGEEGTVLLVEDVPGVTTAELRNQGFEDCLKQKAPNIKVIRQLSVGTRDTHRATIENMLTAYPEISGIFCFMGDIAIPAYNVCKTLGRSDIIIAGYDATPEQVEIMLNDGPDCQLICSLALYPKNIGRVAMETAYGLLAGELQAGENGLRVNTANGMLRAEDAASFEDLMVAK